MINRVKVIVAPQVFDLVIHLSLLIPPKISHLARGLPVSEKLDMLPLLVLEYIAVGHVGLQNSVFKIDFGLVPSVVLPLLVYFPHYCN